MAVHTYRYTLDGPDPDEIARVAAGSVIGSISPNLHVDVDCDELQKDSLDEAMLKFGYAYSSTDPTGTAASEVAPGMRQVLASRVEDDITTVSETWEDLEVVNITTGDGKLVGNASFSSSNAVGATNTDFRVIIDGSSIGGCPNIGAIQFYSDVIAGAHVVKLQWRTGAAGTGRIRPDTVETEHGILVVSEVA